MVRTDAKGGPLGRLRVAEAGGEVATRYCGRLFAALGAEVVQVGDRSDDHVSRPGGGGRAFNLWLDAGKRRAASLGDALAELATADSRPDGKVLVIAGQTPQAVDAVDAAIAGRADVVRLGLTWFGREGPYAGWQGNDALMHALSGLAFPFGEPWGPPTLPQGHSPQLICGIVGYIAGLAGLMAGGRGVARVDVNVLEAAMCLTEVLVASCAAAPDVRFERLGVNRYPPVYPSTVLETTDGHVGITALTAAQWRAFCELIGRPDVAKIPRYSTSGERVLYADEIDEILIPIFRQRPSAHWVEAGLRMKVPITPAVAPGDLPGEAHWRERGSFEPIPGARAQGPTLPIRFQFDGVTRPRPNGGQDGPLTGVKVADFTMGWAGPLATRYLADLGAEVMKIESRAHFDWWRGIDPQPDADPPPHELPMSYITVNRGKFGLDVDVTTPKGQALARAIVSDADVVVDNQGPGVMDKLGLGRADQRRLNPGVISVTMPPFGHSGPLSGMRAYGTTVEHACGMPFVNGYPDWAPCKQHYGYGDPIAGLFGAAGALAALYGRERLGGAEIEVCQVECLFQLNADAIIAGQLQPVERIGNRRPNEGPVTVVRGVGDDAWLCVACDSDAAWRALCGVLGEASLSPDWSLAERQARADQIEAVIEAWSAGRSPQEAAEQLQNAGVPAAPVWAYHDLWTDQHLTESGFWTWLDRRYVGRHLTPNAPMLFDGARPAIRHPAPVLGEHTEVVLGRLAPAAE